MFLEKFRLDGQTALVTGGGRGIGLATAQALLEAGAKVIISDHDQALLDSGKADLAAKGHVVDTALLDVTKSADVTAVAKTLNERHGAVDILVANAGIAWADTPGETMSDEIWHKVMDVNLHGCYYCCREFGRYMLERGRGSIVTLGSMSGIISNKPQRQVTYNASKAAVHHMTKSLAGEWATRGVRINSVAPTYVDTSMTRGNFEHPMFKTWMEFTPMDRVAQPEEIAAPILFLASDAASAITGAILSVDCGYTIW